MTADAKPAQSYATVLVHACDERRFGDTLASAVGLAREHRSHLLVVSAMPQIAFPSYEVGSAAPLILEEEKRAFAAANARLKAVYDHATEGAALAGYTAEWRCIGSGFEPASTVVARQARSADLIVTRQPDASWIDGPRYGTPDALAIESARPVLIVPNGGRTELAAKRIVLAWNGSREATRAVFDALPLLQRAEEVRMMWIDPDSEAREAGDLPCADICAALGRHDIRCEVTQPSGSHGSVGETLVAEAARFGSDLLVMGCYGHSRLREYVLGGATRQVLATMTIPVLMSH